YMARALESFHHMHLIGGEEATAPQPCRMEERDGVEHKRLALPTSYGISQICSLNCPLGIVLAVIGRDHGILAVSAASVASLIEKDYIPIRLDNASGWPLAWDS